MRVPSADSSAKQCNGQYQACRVGYQSPNCPLTMDLKHKALNAYEIASNPSNSLRKPSNQISLKKLKLNIEQNRVYETQYHLEVYKCL